MLNVKAREILAPAHLHNYLQMLNSGMDFGKRLKEIMKQKGIGTSELADRMGVSGRRAVLSDKKTLQSRSRWNVPISVV